MLSAEEHRRVSDAITSAEQNTSGEIFCVVTEKPDGDRQVPFAWAALAALVLPPILLVTGVVGPHLLTGGWEAGAPPAARTIVVLYAALSALMFIVVFLVVGIDAVRVRMTPPSLRRASVHRRALESFLTHGIHVTSERTGVLVYLSLADRAAEIVADEAIHAKVEADVWGAAIAALLADVGKGRVADGIVAAIAACGAVLAEHFPPGPRNLNEIPDKLIEL